MNPELEQEIEMTCSKLDSVQIEEDLFGSYNDSVTGKLNNVKRFTWKNENNITIQVITYGATISSIKTPDKNGEVTDLVMGFDTIRGYQDLNNPYFGATIGRVANRIRYGKFTILGRSYNVTKNNGCHQIHGGLTGFDKVNWDYYIEGKKVVMSYLSAANEEGFPGNVLVHVSFQLTENNEFLIDFKATTTMATYVNLTNHSYFNLAGHDSGAQELYNHFIVINADHITWVDENFIPTGHLRHVVDTPYDLRVPKQLKDTIPLLSTHGYDHNFCVMKGTAQENTFVASAFHPRSGRILEVYSNQPGVQFYTSNNIATNTGGTEGNTANKVAIFGKNGSPYSYHGAFCFETQNWPDAINHKNFPKAILYPGEVYHHSCVYKFFIKY